MPADPKQTAFSLHPGGRDLTLHAAALADIGPKDRVLDIGCGTGESLRLLAELPGLNGQDCEWAGIDCSDAVLRFCRQPDQGPRISWQSGDAACLPFPGGSFDIALMECVITLLEEPAGALREAARVLKPGGRLIISALTDESASGAGRVETCGPHCSDGSPETVCGPHCSDDSPETVCRPHDSLVLEGLLLPQVLKAFAGSLDLTLLCEEDRRSDLIRYLAESIFQYGSVEARIRAENEKTGTSVFDCRCCCEPKKTGYRLFIFRKALAQPL